MVWDNKGDSMKPMTDFDWSIIGGHVYRKNDLPTLPRRRLDVPVPSTVDGLHTLAHRFAGISEQLHQFAREARTVGQHRYGLSQAATLLYQTRQAFKTLAEEWERELREAEAKEKGAADSEEHLRMVR
jgi:hypothetical protein